jgi:ribose transport system permease protein
MVGRGHADKQWQRYIPTPRRVSALYLLVITFLVFGFWIPDIFLTRSSIEFVLSTQAVVGILGLAALVPLVAGVLDFSVGSVMGLSLIVMTELAQHHVNWVLSAVISVAVCAIPGIISGFLVVNLNINSLIATLGMSEAISAISLYISKDSEQAAPFSQTYLNLATGDWLGLPKVVWLLAVIALVVYYLLEWTPLGRALFATSANRESARLAGVPTNRLMRGSLVASALIAGMGGVIYGAQVQSFSNSYGQTFLFPAFAAVFFGATQFRNRPNVWGTIVAVYVLAYGVQGLEQATATGSYWLTPLFDGVALLVAVALASHAEQGGIRKKARSLLYPQAASDADLTANENGLKAVAEQET